MTNSIVICSYRYGHLAAHAIETVLEQTKPFDKIYFVDDGVGDCGHLPQMYPGIEYVFRESNLGIVKNFQDMLQRADTDRVMFLGADNWLRADTNKLLSNSSADIVTYDIMVVGNLRDEIVKRHGNEVTMTSQGYYWDRSGGHHGSMMYNVELAKQVGGYDSPPGRTIEDMVLFHRLLSAGAVLEHVPEAMLFYRRHINNFNSCK